MMLSSCSSSNFLKTLELTNFKRFANISVPLGPSPQVIIGRNGAGKTQILHAILFYLRAYNKQFSDLKEPFYVGSDELFGETFYLGDVNDVRESFARQQQYPAARSFSLKGTFGDATTSTFDYTPMGGLVLKETDLRPKRDYVRFAFVQPTYQWGTERKESYATRSPQPLTFLTTGAQHMRCRLYDLSSEDRDFIASRMQEIIGFDLSFEFGKLLRTFVVDRSNNTRLEIALCGASLQKLVALYICFCTLRTSEFPQRILLLDEPETHLCDNVTDRLFRALVADCGSSGVQLILTSNSPVIINQVDPANRLYLSSVSPYAMSSPSVEYFSELAQLSSSGKAVLVVDGPHDREFVFKFMPEITDAYQIIVQQVDWVSRKKMAAAVRHEMKTKIAFLSDSGMLATLPDDDVQRIEIDLSAHVSSGAKARDACVVLQPLPSIEAYLLLSAYLNGSEDVRRSFCQCLMEYVQKGSSAASFSVNFKKTFSGVKNISVQRKLSTDLMDQCWARHARSAFLEPDQVNIESLLRVVQGHDVVSKLSRTIFSGVANMSSKAKRNISTSTLVELSAPLHADVLERFITPVKSRLLNFLAN